MTLCVLQIQWLNVWVLAGADKFHMDGKYEYKVFFRFYFEGKLSYDVNGIFKIEIIILAASFDNTIKIEEIEIEIPFYFSLELNDPGALLSVQK